MLIDIFKKITFFVATISGNEKNPLLSNIPLFLCLFLSDKFQSNDPTLLI